MLVKYLRDGKRPIGCIVAISRDQIGLTVCSPKDKFDREIAKNLAAGRAFTSTPIFTDNLPARLINNPYATCPDEQIRIPLNQYVESEICLMEDRAKRYFQVSFAELAATPKEIFG